MNDIIKDAKKYILFEANKLDLEKILNIKNDELIKMAEIELKIRTKSINGKIEIIYFL